MESLSYRIVNFGEKVVGKCMKKKKKEMAMAARWPEKKKKKGGTVSVF